LKVPDLVDVQWPRAYRIVNSSFPPIALFEDVLDPEDLEVAYALEALPGFSPECVPKIDSPAPARLR
jgi:hypothetical protein